MAGELSLHIVATFAIIAIAIGFFVSEKVSIETTSLGLVVALLVFFHLMPLPAEATPALTPQSLLAGFASPALITILALLVIGQGLVQTGALEAPTRRLQDVAPGRPQVVLTVILVSAAAISAVLNNTPVVVMFIPIVSAISARLGMSPSKTLMPLSFITILGGMTTLVGSSTNVLVAGLAEEHAGIVIGFFDFLVPGLLLAAIGIVYVIFIAPLLLRQEGAKASEPGSTSGRQFLAEITVAAGHPLEGMSAVAGMFPLLKAMTVRLVHRDGAAVLPPFEDISLRPGDTVNVAATRTALTDALLSGAALAANEPAHDAETATQAEETPQRGGLTIAEAVIAPGSRIVGRSIDDLGAQVLSGCKIIGVQRRSRMVRALLREIRLEAGDVVLVMGTRAQVRGLRLSHDLLLLEWSAAELPSMALALRARVIFAATVLAIATGLVPIVIAALAGAFAMLPARCLNLRQAARAFDRKIYLLIGASLAMATSLEATGGANYVADLIVGAVSGGSVAVIMSVLFALIAILTNLLSNHATAALFTSIAISTAATIGVDPHILVVLVILAANCSFATPMGYQTNLLVMGSGNYRFADFVRTGTPLIFMLWLAYSLFAPWYYGIM